MGCSLGAYCLLVVQFYLFLVVHGAKLPKSCFKQPSVFVTENEPWRKELSKQAPGQADAYCGDRLAKSYTAGTLQLVGNQLHKGLGYGECNVIVSPKTLPGDGGNGKVLLYFTEFKFPESCAEFNVSIFDGLENFKGAPDQFCGHNETLTRPETIFTTSRAYFIVVIRWKKTQTWTSGGFILKFSSFYTGQCSNSKDVTRCVNNRCTPSEHFCDDNIDTCGPWDKHVCEDDEKVDEEVAVEVEVEEDTDAIDAIIWFVGIFGGIMAFPTIGYCLVKCRSLSRGGLGNFFANSERTQRPPSPFREFLPQSDTEESQNPREREERPSSAQDVERQLSVHDDEIQSLVPDDESSIGSYDSSDTRYNMPPPTYDSLALVPHSPVSPAPQSSVISISPSTTPPPSYDTVSPFTSSPWPSAQPPSPPSPPPPSYDTVFQFAPSSPSVQPSAPSPPSPPSYDTVSQFTPSSPSVQPSAPPPSPPSYDTVSEFPSVPPP